MASKARSVGEDNTGALRIGDLDVGDNFVRPSSYINCNRFGDGSCMGIIGINLTRGFLGWPINADLLQGGAVIQRQCEIFLCLFEPGFFQCFQLVFCFSA